MLMLSFGCCIFWCFVLASGFGRVDVFLREWVFFWMDTTKRIRYKIARFAIYFYNLKYIKIIINSKITSVYTILGYTGANRFHHGKSIPCFVCHNSILTTMKIVESWSLAPDTLFNSSSRGPGFNTCPLNNPPHFNQSIQKLRATNPLFSCTFPNWQSF